MYDWAEFRHFRYLSTILEKQGLRAAAELLHTTQPNLSIQAKQFQDAASVRLFRLSKSGRIRPTEAGIAFITLARHLLETRDEVMEALAAIGNGELSRMRLGCCPWVDSELFRDSVRLHREIVASCVIHPMYGDTARLVDEVASGVLDAALVTLPKRHPELQVEQLRQGRLVACLRSDSPLAAKQMLRVEDLQQHPAVLYHPAPYPQLQSELSNLLSIAGIPRNGAARATTPAEVMLLVKDGYGIALLQEGIPLDRELTTRPILELDSMVDTSLVYHKERHPKTIPLLGKMLRRSLSRQAADSASSPGKRPVRSVTTRGQQLELLDGAL